jgi:alpha-ribazole phosphatase
VLVYLIRHAKPDGAEGLCYGRRDMAVSAAATSRAARALRAQIPSAVLRTAPIYSSPLSRCAGLAQELAPARVTLTPALLELDFGLWEGSAWASIPREQLDAWAADPWHYRPGGGERAQSLALRWQQWVEQLCGAGHASAIAVTHAGVIRVALARAVGSDVTRLGLSVEYGSVHPLVVEAASASAPRARSAL